MSLELRPDRIRSVDGESHVWSDSNLVVASKFRTAREVLFAADPAKFAAFGPRSEFPRSNPNRAVGGLVEIKSGVLLLTGLESRRAADLVGWREADFERLSEVVGREEVVELRRSSNDINSAMKPRSTRSRR